MKLPILFPALPVLLLASCCEMDIDQQCYRQGGSSMVGDLGNTGYRAATTNLHKGFQRVGFPQFAKPLDVDVSEMKLIKTATGRVEASGTAAKDIVTADMTLSTSWNNTSDMVIRIFEFTNPIELVPELNRLENANLRAHLKMRDKEARIITRVVRAYNSAETREQSNAGQIDAKVVTGNPHGKIGHENKTTMTRKVLDGTIIGYQWTRIIWSSKNPDQVSHISLDTVFLD